MFSSGLHTRSHRGSATAAPPTVAASAHVVVAVETAEDGHVGDFGAQLNLQHQAVGDGYRVHEGRHWEGIGIRRPVGRWRPRLVPETIRNQSGQQPAGQRPLPSALEGYDGEERRSVTGKVPGMRSMQGRQRGCRHKRIWS